ncbi:MAG: class I SAM-dependent rRNA methyltransferase [Caldimicrobium sp.]|nr:class I SAM-dependent rRNA methyltransferase [Caldimicrobium sp.]MCX7874323.1 class I SAM-dependent rRNA methyltransferase [Caldimicrobium sp.]MDW8094929.1 class I SAM-dependent rRNA methyltransferase [Caldimicrobium sp.]
MKYPPVKLNLKGFHKYKVGTLWFTKEDLQKVEDIGNQVERGDLVSLYSPEGHFLGQGYINLSSHYALKLLTKESVPIDELFFLKRFERALNFRKRIYPQERVFRLIFAEGDLLPGLIIDIFERVAVIQIYTLGMERLKETIISALLKAYPLESIVLKNDMEKRKEEGLSLYVECFLKDPGEIIPIEMDQIRLLIPVKRGQKTGLFLDQRENWRLVRKISEGLTVIDGFSYLGMFSLYALKGGAKRTFLLERSTFALDLAIEIAKLNGWKEKIIPVEGDVLKLLKNPSIEGDLLILDPPAFIKSKSDFERGINRYRELYHYGIKFFKKRNGLLILFSCSHFLSLENLRELVFESLKRHHLYSKIFQSLSQAPDHPINPYVKETEYLKGLALEINSDLC